MRIRSLLLGALALAAPFAAASADAGTAAAADVGEGEVFKYESDISRLRSLVIHSLYSHKDVFLRELLSNANDALEKLRLTALTDRRVLAAGDANVTISVHVPAGGRAGQLVIRDSGIGMSRAELARNLGTIARSGTNEFLKRAEGGAGEGNLIGQFGLGFYSCFLVSPSVRVSSLPPATAENPTPQQHTFFSSAAGDSFEVRPDPRGNTLGRGTEIVLEIGEDDGEFLKVDKLKALIDKHSTFSTTFPIYLREQTADPAADDDAEVTWTHVNNKAPIWMREPASVPKEDYIDFYTATSKDADGAPPLGWAHFRGDTASGVSYRALMYIPSVLPKDFWQKVENGMTNVRLMVKRVFITDDLGAAYMPRWLSYMKVTIDADDLPLNVSRETLQNTRFLKQLQRTLVRKALDLFARLAADEPDKFAELSKVYGNALRIGLIESKRDAPKLAKLLRFESTRSNYTSLEEYVAHRKEGQSQIYFMAGVGQPSDQLARSPFVEKLQARGYEVLLLDLPSDEPMMQALGSFMGLAVQDVAKKGLVFGDEDANKQEQAELDAHKIAFRPLTDWLKATFGALVADVVLTNRLVTSPCTIVVDSLGWSANMARLMAAQGDEQNPMFDMLKKMPRVLEINPKSPLITGLLSRVLDLGERDGEDMSADEAELAETARILFDTTLVRSGFEVEDPSAFFERVEALLRASVGVRLDARADARVLPAPPTASEMPAEAEAEEAKQRERDEREERGEEPEQDDNDKDDFARQFEKMGFNVEAQHEIDDDSFVDWEGFKKEMEHDEL